VRANFIKLRSYLTKINDGIFGVKRKMRRRKSLFWIIPFIMLLVSMTIANVPLSYAQNAVLSAPSPFSDETLTSGSTFFINITIDDIQNLWGYQFALSYNTSILTATDFVSYSPFTFQWPSSINDTLGQVTIAYSRLFGDPGTTYSEPTPIAGINFTVDDLGESALNIHDSELSDPSGNTIYHEVVDGYFTNMQLPTHDIAVTDVTINVTGTETVLPGVVININVTVLNQGSSTETFDVTVYYDTNTIDTATVTSMAPLTFEKLSFNWDTTGLSVGSIYTVKAVADVTDDEDPTDNEFVDGEVQLGTRDVAIIDLDVANVTKPNLLLVNVTVKNEGDMTETFNVTVYYGVIDVIGVQTVTDLAAGASKTLTFTLNTTEVEVDDYKIRALASEVERETDTDDNDTDRTVPKLSVTVHIGVQPGYPEAHFTYSPDSPIVDETVTFDASASIDNDTATEQDPDGAIASYAWDFGDGTTAIYTGANLTATTNHTYTERGTFTVTLTVTDNATQSDTVGKNITILSHDIAVTDITAQPTKVTVGDDVTITVTVENQGDFTETFNMSVYYDTTLIITQIDKEVSSPAGTTTQVNFTWTTTGVAAGTYDIRADITTVKNETDTADNTKSVAGLVAVLWPPVASFTYSPAEPLVGETVTFNASLSTEYGVATIVSYAWDFGDGTTAIYIGANLTDTTTHAYDTRGAYTVSLTITDSEGLSDSTTQDITVKAHDIAVTSVVVSPTKVTIGESVSINVTVENQGNFTETFDVTIYYDNTEIDTQTVTGLAAGASKVLTFTWDTTDVDEDDYTIKATAETVPDETDTADNTKTSPDTVTVEAAPAPDILLYAGIAAVIIVVIIIAVYFLKIRKPEPT